jgi:hypothetical protein
MGGVNPFFVQRYLLILRFRLVSQVSDIADPLMMSLPIKDFHNRVDGIRLVLLYFEIKLHLYSTFLTVSGL